MPEPLTLSQAFVAAASSLRRGGIDTPELDARLLLCHAAALSHEAYVARAARGARPRRPRRGSSGRSPAPRASSRCRASSARASSTAGASRVDANCARPAARHRDADRGGARSRRRQRRRDRPLSLLDLGTGTGCILLTLLAELPSARGFGTDIAVDALSLAEANAHRLGVADRATLHRL